MAISNVKHKSGKLIGLVHPIKVPTPHSPYIVVSVSMDQKLNFWILSETISRDHTFESLCCTNFKNVTLYLIYTPWKLLHYFKCWAKNNSPKGNLAIAFHLQTRHSLKLLNSSENGKKTLFDSKRHYFAISFLKNFWILQRSYVMFVTNIIGFLSAWATWSFEMAHYILAPLG